MQGDSFKEVWDQENTEHRVSKSVIMNPVETEIEPEALIVSDCAGFRRRCGRYPGEV
jgi:hypothetical protein